MFEAKQVVHLDVDGNNYLAVMPLDQYGIVCLIESGTTITNALETGGFSRDAFTLLLKGYCMGTLSTFRIGQNVSVIEHALTYEQMEVVEQELAAFNRADKVKDAVLTFQVYEQLRGK